MTHSEIVDIIETSQRNNAKKNITGMLIYQRGLFIQALEGEKETVDELYNKIAKDERHYNASIIIREPIAERAFEGWSMGLKNIDLLTDDEQEQYADILAKPITRQNLEARPNRARRLLMTFSR